MRRQGVKLGIVLFSALTSTRASGKGLAQALRLVDDVRRQGITPDIVTFSALYSTCEQGTDLTRAPRLFEDMRRQGIKLDIGLISALFPALTKKGHGPHAIPNPPPAAPAGGFTLPGFFPPVGHGAFMTVRVRPRRLRRRVASPFLGSPSGRPYGFHDREGLPPPAAPAGGFTLSGFSPSGRP